MLSYFFVKRFCLLFVVLNDVGGDVCIVTKESLLSADWTGGSWASPTERITYYIVGATHELPVILLKSNPSTASGPPPFRQGRLSDPFATLRVTEVSAAGGRYSEPEEGKVTSNQEGIYAVAGCDDNYSGDRCAVKYLLVILRR